MRVIMTIMVIGVFVAVCWKASGEPVNTHECIYGISVGTGFVGLVYHTCKYTEDRDSVKFTICKTGKVKKVFKSNVGSISEGMTKLTKICDKCGMPEYRCTCKRSH